MRFKTIIRNINLLNITLITAVIILANYTILPMFNMGIKYTLPAGKKTIGDTDEKPADSHIPSLTDYTMIAEENLFHPERKIPVEKKEEQPLPKPDFVLYGTLIMDDMRIAYMEDLKAPRNTQGRGKRQTAMRKGAALSGFTLKEIETDKVVMLRGEEKIVVPINDPAHPKDRKESGITAVTPQQPAQAAGVPPKKVEPVSSKHETKQKHKTEKPQKAEKLPREPGIPMPASTDSVKGSVEESPLRPDIKTLPGLGQQYKPSGTGGALLFPNR